MKIETIISGGYEPVWWFCIRVPRKAANLFLEKNGTGRILCSVNGHESFQAALMPKGDGSYFINLNKERRKKYNVQPNDQVTIVLEKDNSKYGLPMPEEFQELLYQDPEGDKVFHSMTLGKQRSLLHIIGKPKSQDLRIHKGIVVLNYLKRVKGQLDFKELNEAFKEANQKR